MEISKDEILEKIKCVIKEGAKLKRNYYITDEHAEFYTKAILDELEIRGQLFESIFNERFLSHFINEFCSNNELKYETLNIPVGVKRR